MTARASAEPFTQIELSPAHWVLRERQLVNWGSYDGHHVFAPSTADDGTVTLLTGQSESGKSTLVDAQVSLLYPTGAAFNKASNAGRSDRSDYSYLRGQRGVRSEDGHDEPVFLRGETTAGEPYPVWGAIVDRYEDTANGGVRSIAKFLYLPAGGASADVVKLFATADGPIDPRLLDAYRDEIFSAPLIKRVYPDAAVYRQANQFHEDVWSMFGLTEAACRLLHRMQASDAPSRLDDIFRQGVLDEPSAIARGRSLIDDYGRFSENFTAIERNLRRVRMLEEMRDAHARYLEARGDVDALRAVDPDRDGSDAVRAAWLDMRARRDVEAARAGFERDLERGTRDADEARETIDGLERELAAIRQRARGQGGERLERLADQLRHAEETRRAMAGRLERLVPRFTKAGLAVPDTMADWQALAVRAARTLDDYQDRRDEIDARRYPLMQDLSRLRGELDELRADYERKRSSRTRITRQMDAARALIAQATGLDPEELPYVAELMDVDAEHEQWRTAMNVVHASLAPVILVDARHERGFARKVSAIPREAMSRRNWRFVDVDRAYGGRAREGWMSGAITVNEESPFADWVRARVSDMRSDARCVERIDDADERTRQVQRDGQIKDGEHGSHGTKDLQQVIGFVTEDYLRELAAGVGRAEREVDAAQGRLDEVDAQLRELDAARELAQSVHDTEWDDIDARSADARIEMLRRTIDELRADPVLAELEADERACTRALEQARRRLALAERDRDASARALDATRAWLDSADARAVDGGSGAPGDAGETLLQAGYDAYFGAGTDSAERAGRILAPAATGTGGDGTVMAALARTLSDAVAARLRELRRACDALRSGCETSMGAYIERFMRADGRVVARVEDFPVFEDELRDLRRSMIRDAADREYFNSLDKIYRDLMELNRAIEYDRTKITGQMDKINALLERYPFGARRGRLSIEVRVTAPDARFMTALRGRIADLNAYQQTDGKDLARCKALFAACAPFVELVKASFDETAASGHGNANLDARRRSRFYGKVAGADGAIERINSTGGGSGGYLQELTSFAYGAALMYLLANDDATEPSYATVFLDEALIKADGQYTRRALSVLPGLGFQVIVSAPESKTGEIMASASKVVVARRDPDTGVTTLREAVLAGPADG